MSSPLWRTFSSSSRPGNGARFVVPAQRERIGAIFLRDAGFPIETAAAALPERGHDLAELRVHACTVVTLVVVLEDDFPVGLDRVIDPMPDSQFGQRVALQTPRDFAEHIAQRLASARDSHEYVSAPAADLDPMQPEAGFVDSDVRCAMQLTVQTVIPRMVGAADSTLELPLLFYPVGRTDQLRTAMPTDIIKSAYFTVFVADQEDALPGNVDQAEVAFLFESLDATRTKPLRVENRIAFRLEMPVVQVALAGQCLFEFVRHVCGIAFCCYRVS